MRMFPQNGVIESGDQGGGVVDFGRLPLTYAAFELVVEDSEGKPNRLWAHQRIRGETFDISGGWVSSNMKGQSTLTFEPYLKALKGLHINTGHIAETPGYTDNEDLYLRYPLKYFNKLQPFENHSDTVRIQDTTHKVAVYVATSSKELRAKLDRKRESLLAAEQAIAFDPARNDVDFRVLADALK